MSYLKRQSITLVFCLLGILLFKTDCNAQDLAAIPYSQIIKMAQGENKDPNAKSYKMRISSSLVDVRPEQIELLLDTKEAPTHLIVDDKGYFEVPNTKKLHEEDPLLIANQPRGTLNISFKMEVGGYVPPKIENGKISYKKLFEGVLDLQREVREVDPTFGLMGKGQFALRITTDKPIKINREMGVGDRKIKGSRTFRPINGIIYLFMEAYMFDDNPVVEIPGDVTIEIKQFPSHVAEKIKADY